jgi:unsaturated rhamnogalacturonyl hydrolase
VSSTGAISNSFNNLDSMNSGNVLLALFKETGQAKYRIAADKIRNRLDTYPTINEAWWHSTSDSRRNQTWADGVFMVLPFLVRYGHDVNNRNFPDGNNAYAEAVKQLKLYYANLRDPSTEIHPSTEMLRHAYDGSPAGQKASWANPTTGQSPETWCRGQGWFFMTLIEVLEIIPTTQPGRQDLITMLQRVIPALQTYQDSASGRWFQLVIRGSNPSNWTETSCSAMYTYVISRAVERGYVDASFNAVALRGWEGIKGRVNSNFDVSQICVGTNVGSTQSFYYGRTRATNDLHGLGAFIIAAEQLQRRTAGT